MIGGVLGILFFLGLCAATVLFLGRSRDVVNPPINYPVTIPHGIHDPSTANISEVYSDGNAGVEVEVQLGNDQVSVEDGTAYMLVKLKGIENELHDKKVRLPLNLSLVIDRSGSMMGDKLDNVKKALEEIAPMLTVNDKVSVVVYDDEVSTVYLSDSFDKEAYLSVIREMLSGDSTYLEGGLREGLRHVQRNSNGEYLNRVILLSDGLANVGISDSETLMQLTKELAGEDIVVSTIGVGSDYDEKIMTAIARAGNGNYYFLENPADAERIFSEELNSLVNTVAKDIRIDFVLNGEFEITRGIGYDLENTSFFKPHDLYAGKESSYLFEINAQDLHLRNIEDFILADLKISYKSVESNSYKKISMPIKATVVEGTTNALADDSVYKEFMLAYQADELWKVYENLDISNNSEAREQVNYLLSELESANVRMDGEFDDEISALKTKREFLIELKEQDVNSSKDGMNFQKGNQYDSFKGRFGK